jgi:C4-dicarboxylate-specific signal transduction histidine kinase
LDPVSDSDPPLEWLAAANRLALIATQLSNVIHETNNILQIIGGNAELLAMSDVPPAVAQRARAITDQTERASALLGEVLAFYREAGAKTERVDMKAVVERSVMLRRFSLSRARIEVLVEGGGEYPVVGNRGQLLQTMLIVLINAEQALSGSPDARIGVQLASTPDRVTVLVSDNAPGAAPDVPAAPSRLTWTLETPDRLGIGLAVAGYLLALHGGMLEIAPASPRGTTVSIILPRSQH